MKILGIVAEYNPFHLGHKYHIEKAKQKYNCDCVVVVMSGNYVQRGDMAIIDKYTRAKIAINNNVDLVIELPFPFSCQNAELFALSAIKELKKIKATAISFGCENTDIETLYKIANLQLEDNNLYKETLKYNLSIGLSYPQALNKTLCYLLKDKININDDILLPNNILAIEYIKASIKLQFNVRFIPIKRHISQHNDLSLNKSLASATAIRKLMLKRDIESLQKYVSKNTFKLISEYFQEHNNFNTIEKYLDIIYYKINLDGKEKIKTIYDVTEGLENKIYNNIYKYDNLNDFILSIKSKRFTYTRIRRILLNILLNITKDRMAQLINYKNNYVKILAFNNNGKEVLSYLRKTDTNPITKYADYHKNNINSKDDLLFNYTNKATNLYYLFFNNRKELINYEYHKSVLYIR